MSLKVFSALTVQNTAWEWRLEEIPHDVLPWLIRCIGNHPKTKCKSNHEVRLYTASKTRAASLPILAAILGRVDYLAKADDLGLFAGLAGIDVLVDTLVAAFRSKSVEAIRFVHRKIGRWPEFRVRIRHKTTISSLMADTGDLECIKYGYETGCIERSASISLASSGNLECLRYVCEKGLAWEGTSMMTSAVTYGHLDCIKYLHESGESLDASHPIIAARGGYVPVLQYLHENGCPIDRKAVFQAAICRRRECLKYLYDNGYSGDFEYREYELLNTGIRRFINELEKAKK